MTLYQRNRKAEYKAKQARIARDEAEARMEEALQAVKRIKKFHFIEKRKASRAFDEASRAYTSAWDAWREAEKEAKEAEALLYKHVQAGTDWLFY